jgi:hypothetical protein
MIGLKKPEETKGQKKEFPAAQSKIATKPTFERRLSIRISIWRIDNCFRRLRPVSGGTEGLDSEQ